MVGDEVERRASAAAGRPRGTRTDERHAVRAQVEHDRGDQAADDEHERARDAGASRTAAPRIDARARRRRRAASPTGRRRVPAATTRAPATRWSPSADVPVSLGSSPMTTSIGRARRGTRSRRPSTGSCAIQPIRSAATSRNRTPVASAIAATSCAASSPPRPVSRTAPPATAASDELGPGRDVARRAEQRVDDRAGRGRVQAVLHRDPGDARVAEVLGHDHRRDRDARDHVAAQPPPVVARQPGDDGQDAREAAARRAHAPGPAAMRPARAASSSAAWSCSFWSA